VSTCGSCGRVAAATDLFCGGCGTSLRVSCPRCGRTAEPGATFCTGCGLRLAERTPVSHEDRRRVSVLFVDVVDFTPYAESADPEQVRLMQQDYFGAVRRVVRQYGGVVEKYIGDAVMALFGAPVATESDALRCVRAGLEIQRILPRQGRAQLAGLRFRVGVATGEALVDLAAAHDGGQAIVAGDVVNTAARLQAVAPAGTVLACAATHAATRDDLEYAEQEPQILRGRSEPSRVWLALSLRRQRPDADVDPVPLVGREHELNLLLGALHRSIGRQTPQLVTVFGAAGIGKSRLLRELARHAQLVRDPAVCWRSGHCPPFGEDVTYAALADIVTAHAGILDTDDQTATRLRLDTALAGMFDAAEAHRLADALAPLVGLPGPSLPPAEVESAWRRLLLAMAAQAPTVLLFEDLHWADESMLRFVERLAAAARGLPLLIVCTARPELRERHPAWTSTVTGTVSVSLPPLRDSDISTLYATMFGQAAVAAHALEPLVELAAGNPLYAHEYVRMLADRGSLAAPDRPWAPGTGDLPPMPDNVQAVIANRIDLLDPADRAVLQAAAVVGSQFWPGAVARGTGTPIEVVEWALRRLEQRDLVAEERTSTMAGQLEFRFRHILVRDVCYQHLPRSERISRHLRAAEWLEQVAHGRAGELAEVIANHRWTAHEISRTLGVDPSAHAPAARQAILLAARRSYALHALETAAQWVSRAQSLPLPPDPALELLDLELAFYRDVDTFLEADGADRLTRLSEVLLATGDRAGAARAWTLVGTAAWVRADRATALAALDRAVELYADLPDTEEKAQALLELARAHMLNYETTPAIAAAETAAAMAAHLGLDEVAANATITTATARYLAGEPDGFAAIRAVADHCRRRRLSSRRRAAHNLAWALLEEGDVAASQRIIDEQRSLDVAGGHSMATNFADDAARAYFAGDWAASLAATRAAVSGPSVEWDLHVLTQSAWLRVLRGEAPDPAPDGGDPVAHAVVEARRSGFHKVVRSTLAHAALCRAVQGRLGEADDLLAELDEDWSRTRMIAFGEWVAAATHAAVLLGEAASRRGAAMLDRSPRRTPWVRAAAHSLAGALAGPAGGADHLAAAEAY
jgi:class 3 adenylate cyclase